MAVSEIGKSKENLLKELSSEFEDLKSINESKDSLYSQLDHLSEKLGQLEDKEINEMQEEDEFGYDEIMRECLEIISKMKEETEELFNKTRKELETIEKLSGTEEGFERLEKELEQKRALINS